MEILSKKIVVTIALSALFAAGCTHKGEPTAQGEALTAEQLHALANDQSMNGKLVTVTGYAGLGGSMFVNLDRKNEMHIHADGIGVGEKLITAQIVFDSGDSVPLSGEESRNYARFLDKEKLSDETIVFMTDDYQEVPNGKLKFSGTIVYNGSNYQLENVTIHK